MKRTLALLTAGGITLSLAACSRSDQTDALVKLAQKQNETIQSQQQMLLDQQQSIADQEARITILMEQMRNDEEMLRQIHEQLLARASDAAPANLNPDIDLTKSQVVKSLAGFNGRLSASIGYAAYADALSDLNSSVATSLLQVKDPNFVDTVNRIVRIYNLGGDFWEKFVRDNTEEISLSQADRARYASVGVSFVDNYHPRPPDVRKFWRVATTQLQSLMESNQQELGIATTAFQR